jgi:hypothetical protein
MNRAGTFDAGEVPDEHESEVRFRIGPFAGEPAIRSMSA